MEASNSEEVRACIERNQLLIDCLLARRAQDQRRCDLYQRIQQAQEAQRRTVEAATAMLQKELLTTLEKVYVLEGGAGTKKSSTLIVKVGRDDSAKGFDAAEQLRSSITETQRFNEALRVEVLRYTSCCDSLKQTVRNKEARCCAVQDKIDEERTRSTRVGCSSRTAASASPHAHPSNTAQANEEVMHSFMEALLLDVAQFYRRGFGAVRDDVVDYIALQDEFYAHIRRTSSPSLTTPVFEASLLNSVQMFANTYTQLRREEQQRYQEILRTVTRLLREWKS
jgi:hypothetical protein